MKLFDQLAEQYGAVIDCHAAHWTIGDTDFVHTGERIYTEVDCKLAGPGKKSKSLRSVEKFIAEVGV